MPRYASKQTARVDVLVVGDHPAALLAAAILKQKSNLRIVHASVSKIERNGADDRLVTINPALFSLHPLLASLAKTLPTVPLYGLQFLSDRVETRSDHRNKSAVAYVARYSAVRTQMQKLTQDIEMLGSQALQIHRVDETGLEISLGKYDLKPSALILTDDLPAEQKAMLGIPTSWGPDVVHRFTIARCKASKHLNLNGKLLMPMSLDLCGELCWGWLMPGDGDFQLAVEQPIEKKTPTSGVGLLHHWVRVLQSHGVLGPKFEVPVASIQSEDLPLAGALAHEGVANRTLLIGPAGGFYSACGEEIYPGCWSALFAADVMKKALKEKHLQDALDPFRQKWRTTLGDYLRGPQQNLRFLLPLVYRNPAMTARLAEAILLSKSVVR